MSRVRIGIIIGSTRPGRRGAQVAQWVFEHASSRDDAEFELVDLAEFALPQLDEELPASSGKYANAHTQAWSEKIDSFDGFIFVTPEYNHAPSGVLKNAIDFLYREWNNKAAGLVSYGSAASGLRAAEILRLVLAEVQIATVRQQVGFSLIHDFENYTVMQAGPQHAAHLSVLLDQLIAWSGALRGVREAQSALAAA